MPNRNLNRNLNKFEQFIFNKALMENVALSDTKSSKTIDKIIKKKYKQLYFNQLLMTNVISDNLYESVEDVILKILAGQWDKDPKNFFNSINGSKRFSFLTPYTIKELETFDLYKVDGYNVGFAIKQDGDIVLVHNNERIKGIGKHLMKKSIQYGGKKLDHFDGFLTGFYKSLNFNVRSNDHFSKEFAPKKWAFEPVNINDPNNSIYVNEIHVLKDVFDEAKNRYENGMPDIVYRTL